MVKNGEYWIKLIVSAYLSVLVVIAENSDSDDYVVYEDDSEAPDEFGQELSDFLSSSLETDENDNEHDAIKNNDKAVTRERPGQIKDKDLDETMMDELPDESEEGEDDEDDIMSADHEEEEEVEHQILELSDHIEQESHPSQSEADITKTETKGVDVKNVNEQDSGSSDTIKKSPTDVKTVTEREVSDVKMEDKKFDTQVPKDRDNVTPSSSSSNKVLNGTSEMSNSTKPRDEHHSEKMLDKTEPNVEAADPRPLSLPKNSGIIPIELKILTESAKKSLSKKKSEALVDSSVPEIPVSKSSTKMEEQALSTGKDPSRLEEIQPGKLPIFLEPHQDQFWPKFDPIHGKTAAEDQEVNQKQLQDEPMLPEFPEAQQRRVPEEPKWSNKGNYDYFSAFQHEHYQERMFRVFIFTTVGLIIAILCCVFSKFLERGSKKNWDDESTASRRGKESVNSYLDDEIFP